MVEGRQKCRSIKSRHYASFAISYGWYIFSGIYTPPQVTAFSFKPWKAVTKTLLQISINRQFILQSLSCIRPPHTDPFPATNHRSMKPRLKRLLCKASLGPLKQDDALRTAPRDDALPTSEELQVALCAEQRPCISFFKESANPNIVAIDEPTFVGRLP